MRAESMMRYKQSKPQKANRDAWKARAPFAVSIDPIDLWAKATGKIDRAIASIAVSLTMRPELSL